MAENPYSSISLNSVDLWIELSKFLVLPPVIQKSSDDPLRESGERRTAALSVLRRALEDGPPAAAAAAAAAAAGCASGPNLLRELLTEALRRAEPRRAALLLPLWPAADVTAPEPSALRRPPPSLAALCALAVSEDACRRLTEAEWAALVAGRGRPALETVLLCGELENADTLRRLMDCVLSDLDGWLRGGLLLPLLPVIASHAWSRGRLQEAVTASALCARQTSVSGDALVRRWCRLLAGRGALVRRCLQRAVLTDTQRHMLLQVSGRSSALAVLSVGCPGPAFPPPDADRLIEHHCLTTDPRALECDRQLLRAYRAVTSLLTGLSALAEAEDAAASLSSAARRQSSSSHVDPAPAPQPWFGPPRPSSRRPQPEPPDLDTLLSKLNLELHQLQPQFKLQVLEVLYCVLFLRSSDADRSGADDQPSPASPSGGVAEGASLTLSLPPAGARLLLTGPAQRALTKLMKQQLAALTDGTAAVDGRDGKRLAPRRDRLLSLVERHRARLSAVEPFAADWPLSALLRAEPDTLLAICWERGWLRHAALLTETFPESGHISRMRTELTLAEGLEECRRSFCGSGPAPKSRRAPDGPLAPGPTLDGADGGRTDGGDGGSPSGFSPETSSGHLRRTIGRLALRALNSDTALYRVVSLVERHGVALPGTAGRYEGLSAGYAAFFDLALTSDCRELFVKAASSLREALVVEPHSAAGLSALAAAVGHWLFAPSESAGPLAPDLPREPGPAAVLLSSAPLSAPLAQAAGRRWRRLVELASRPPSSASVSKLAALAHRLAPDAGGPVGSHEHRPDFLMSLLHTLNQLQTLLPDVVPASEDCVRLLSVAPSIALADRALRCTSAAELSRLSSGAAAIRLDLGRLMLGRLWPQLETPARVRLWSDGSVWEDRPPAAPAATAAMADSTDGKTLDQSTTSLPPPPTVASRPAGGRRRSFPPDVSAVAAAARVSGTPSPPSGKDRTAAGASATAAAVSAAEGVAERSRLVYRLTAALPRLAERLSSTGGPDSPPPPEPTPAALAHISEQSTLLSDLRVALTGGAGRGCRLLRAASADGSLASLTAEAPARARLATLLRAERWTEAAELALSLQFLPEMDGCTDAVLALRVLHSEGDADTGWRLVQQMSSQRCRAAVIAEMAPQWPLRRCLDLLTGTDGMEELRERLLLAEELLQLWRQCRGPPVPGWAELERRCRRQPALLSELLSAASAECRPPLYRRWSRLWGVGGAELPPPPPAADQLATLLREPAAAPVTAVRQLLCSVDPAEVVSLCGRLHSVPARAALLSGLCTAQGSRLSASQYGQLYRHAAGLRLLGLLGAGWPHYQHLAARPELIVIQLICNQHFETAGRALRLLWRLGLIAGSVPTTSGTSDSATAHPPRLPHPVPPLDAAVNACLERLAERALDVSRLPAPPPQTPPSLPLVPPQQTQTPSPAAAPRHRWAADDSSTGCMRCGAAFSARFRRHHCRRCGKLVCEPCSKYRAQLDGCGPTPVRVCSVCVLAAPVPATTTHPSDAGDTVIDAELIPDNVTRAREPCSAGPPALRLTESSAHNVRQLERVQFGHAPSVSTCLLLLQLHTEAAAGGRLVLQAARQLLWHPPPAAAAHPALAAELARQLAMAAKLLLTRAERPAEEAAACDALLRAADVSRLLQEAGCGELAAGADLADRAALRRLQAALVGRELWRPALDVSTKAGLDCGAVWAAWGLATLRAGHLSAARPRLARALRPAAEPERRRGQARLLSAAVAALESTPAAADSTPAALLRAEAELEQICSGHLPSLSGPPPAALDEAVYYLRTYGTPRQTLAFLQRHGRYSRALMAARELSARPEDFHWALLVPSVRRGQLKQLLDALRETSPSLAKWKTYLEYSCSELQQSGAWHTLLQLQLACGDLLRAASTCIRLYCRQSNYRCYAQSLHHLEAARDRLSEYLNGADWKEAGSADGRLRLVLPWKQVSQQLTAVELQIQVTRFLSDPRQLWDQSALSEEPAPTLLAGADQQHQLLVTLLAASSSVPDALCLAHRIERSLSLDLGTLLPAAAERLVSAGRLEHLHRLLQQLMETAQLSQDTLRRLVALPPAGHPSVGLLLTAITEPAVRLEALVQCRRYKAAYMLAASRRRPAEVAAVLAGAEADGQAGAAVATICRRWLQRHAPLLLSASATQLPPGTGLDSSSGAATPDTRPGTPADGSLTNSMTSIDGNIAASIGNSTGAVPRSGARSKTTAAGVCR